MEPFIDLPPVDGGRDAIMLASLNLFEMLFTRLPWSCPVGSLIYDLCSLRELDINTVDEKQSNTPISMKDPMGVSSRTKDTLEYSYFTQGL